MTVDIHLSAVAAVPEDFKDNDQNEMKLKIDFIDENFSEDDQVQSTLQNNLYQISSKKLPFIGITKEELKSYINNRSWKRIRYIVGLCYLLLIIFLLIISILLIIFSYQCPKKKNLIWYEKEIIYEIDIKMFQDSNNDGIGDLNGLQDKLNYLEKNSIKTILLQSNLFSKKKHLLTLNQQILNQTQLEYFMKILRRKDMHLILDLPLSSTNNQNASEWYQSIQIQNPCEKDQSNIGCQYLLIYGKYPLDFNKEQIQKQTDFRIRYWLLTKKIHGLRLDLPLELNEETGLYNISYKTIHRWNSIKNEIEKKTKPKLIVYDIPIDLNHFIINKEFLNQITYPILSKQSFFNSQLLNQRIQSFKLNQFSLPKFWQLGSIRKNDQISNNLSKEMILTMGMLFGGTPIILYGEELGFEQKINRLMLWTSEKPCGNFSSCQSDYCRELFSSFHLNISEINVQREEAMGRNEKDSLLIYFRYLSKLRQLDSFQYGYLETGYQFEFNLFWFIREAPGHRGYLILFNLNNEISHISLYKITNYLISEHIKLEYQWPNKSFINQNSTHINSDNLFIHSQSIYIFSWKEKLIQPNLYIKKVQNYLAN